jgi:carboxyl-terminal processing protease
MKQKKRVLNFLGLVGSALVVVLGLITLGVVLDRKILSAFIPLGSVPPDAEPEFRLLAEGYNTIQRFYVNRSALSLRELTYGALAGMTDALEDKGHSTFLTPDMARVEKSLSEGRLQGIGVEIQMKGGHVVIVTPLDKSPAERAGLRPGEIILAVDGRRIADLPLGRVVEQITGPEGTPVELTILDPKSGRTRDVPIVRAAFTLHNVTWQRLPGTQVADLRVAAFSEGVSGDLRKALGEINRARLNRVILDLRNDPGGLLQEAVAAASEFLRDGNVLRIRDALGREKPVPVQTGGVAFDLRMVVLINGGTGSAAEVLAGALQDRRRAALLGETSFGTGTVLNQFNLSDGSALLLAVEEWLTPGGQTFWHKGITPDHAIPLPPETLPLFPEAIRDMTPSQLQETPDKQLLSALDLLLQP